MREVPNVPTDEEMIAHYSHGLKVAMARFAEVLDPILRSNPEFVPNGPPSVQAGVVMHALLILGVLVAQENDLDRDSALDILNGIKSDLQDPTARLYVQRTLGPKN